MVTELRVECQAYIILTHLTPCLLPYVSVIYCEFFQSSNTKKLEMWTLLLLYLFLVCESTQPVMFVIWLIVMLLVYNIGYWYHYFTQWSYAASKQELLYFICCKVCAFVYLQRKKEKLFICHMRTNWNLWLILVKWAMAGSTQTTCPL